MRMLGTYQVTMASAFSYEALARVLRWLWLRDPRVLHMPRYDLRAPHFYLNSKDPGLYYYDLRRHCVYYDRCITDGTDNGPCLTLVAKKNPGCGPLVMAMIT